MAARKGKAPESRSIQEGDQDPPVLAPENDESIVPEGEEGQITEAPTTFTFCADVEGVYADKYVLIATNNEGGTATLEFDKDAVTFEGQDVVNLEEGYKDMTFTVSYALAVEKHMPEFFGIASVLPAEPAEDQETSPPAVDITPPPHLFDRHYLGKETIVAEVELTEAELIEVGKRVSKAMKERVSLKRIASDYSAQAKRAEDEAYTAMEIQDSGREERRINCDMVADFTEGVAVYVESEWPHREVRRRPLTEKDRQLKLWPMTNSPAAPKVESPAEPETVTLSGRIVDIFPGDEDTPNEYTVAFEDSEGNEMEFVLQDVDASWFGSLEEDGEQRDITMPLALALEYGIVDAPAEPDVTQDRSCGTCGHLRDAPGGDEPSPCAECGQDPGLPNWTDEYRVPADGQKQPEAVQ